MAKGFRTGPPGYIGWRAGTTTPYAIVDFIPQSGNGTMNLATDVLPKCSAIPRKQGGLILLFSSGGEARVFVAPYKILLTHLFITL